MAEKALITRRAAFVGALASTAALAVPAAASVTEPSKGDKLQHFLDTASADNLVQYHASKLAEALCEARPGLWRFNLTGIQSTESGGFVLFHRRESESHFVGVAQDYI